MKREALAQSIGCANIDFTARVAFDRLPSHISSADICLGVFGSTSKAQRVIPNKVWHALAVGRPVVTGDGPAVREVLRDGEHCLLVPFGNASAIARALTRLADDEELARRLVTNGADLVHGPFSSTALGRGFANVLAEAIEQMPRQRE